VFTVPSKINVTSIDVSETRAEDGKADIMEIRLSTGVAIYLVGVE